MAEPARHVATSRDGHALVDAPPGQIYEVAVVPRNRAGGRGALADGARTLVWSRGRRTQPSNVASLTGQVVQGIVVLQWAAVTDDDLAGYEIKAGPRWTGGLPIARGIVGTVYVAPVDWIGSRTFRIKAVNRAGIVSDTDATVVVTVASSAFARYASRNEHTGWAGTKTTMAVSGAYLRLSTGTGLAGSYQSRKFSPASLADWRIFVSLECDIEDVTLYGGRAQVGATSPYALRRMGTAADWEGSENNELGAADSALFWGDDFYAQNGGAGATTIFDFQRNGVGFVVEYRTSTDGGGSWSAWTAYQAGVVANCNAVQARVSVSTVHAELVPRLRTLSIATVDPCPDSVINNDAWVREWRFQRVFKDTAGTFAVADASVVDATDETGHSIGVNLATAATTKVSFEFSVPEDLDLSRPITAQASGYLSGAPAAKATLKLTVSWRVRADNEAYVSGGSTGSGTVSQIIGSTGSNHSSADLCVVAIGTVFSGGALSTVGQEVVCSIKRSTAGADEYGGTFMLTRVKLLGTRKKR